MAQMTFIDFFSGIGGFRQGLELAGMHEERDLGCPTLHYFDVCLEGYLRFGFDAKVLEKALIDSVGRKKARLMLKEVRCYG